MLVTLTAFMTLTAFTLDSVQKLKPLVLRWLGKGFGFRF
jgi:hypothetical protein